MNQKCPSCGNYVEGKKKATIGRKMTRGAVKKGSAVATGALIGSVVPGLGTLLGGVLGLAADALMSDTTIQTADEMYDAAVGEIEYEFSCPKCGRKWTKKVNTLQQNKGNASSGNSHNTFNRRYSNQSNTYSQPTTPRYDNTDWQEKFNKEFNSYLETSDKILSSKEDSVLQYVYDLEYEFSACKNDVIYSEFQFLRAFACLQYSLNNVGEKSLISHGRYFISIAIRYLEDEEYQLVSLLFEILAIDTKNGNAPTKIKKLQQRCPNIPAMENTLFKTEYWQNVYEEACYNKLLDVAVYNEEQNKEGAVIDAFQRISELADIGYKLSAYRFLYEKFLEIDPAKSFDYARKATVLTNFEKEYNSEIPMHKNWLDCLNFLGYCYGEGVGTEIDYDKAFVSFYRCARLSHPLGMANLAECYELGHGVSKDIKTALEWYKKAADAGVESAKEKLKEFEGVIYNDNEVIENSPSLTENVTANEQEYLEELKACLEEDNEISPKERRLLERLREKLGITPGRAKELEDSLKVPQITDAEKEYLDEYKACLEEDSEITAKERRLLNRIRESLGISEERANEIEKL